MNYRQCLTAQAVADASSPTLAENLHNARVAGLSVEAWDPLLSRLVPNPVAHRRQTLADATSLSSTQPHGHWCSRSASVLGLTCQQSGHRWEGLSVLVGASRNIPSASPNLYSNIPPKMPQPTSKIERFSPDFWRFRFPFLDFLVIPLILSFSVTTMLLLLTICAVTLCAQFCRWLLAWRCNLLIWDWAFFQRLEPKTFFLKLGERFRRFCLDATLIFSVVAAKKRGFSILVPSLQATAVKVPKSTPIAPVPVSRTGSHLTVMLAYHTQQPST